MKKLILLFALLSLGFTEKDEIVPWDTVITVYASGDMFTDTAALQAALDTGNDVNLNNGQTYSVSSLLVANVSGGQKVFGNNANINYTAFGQIGFRVSKASGIFEMENVNIDAQTNIRMMFDLESPVNFDNVDVSNGYSNQSTVYAWYIQVTADSKGWGDYNFDNCDCTNMNADTDAPGGPNGGLGNHIGTSRCMYVDWIKNDTGSSVTVDNANWSGVWGDDGDLLHVDDHQGGGTINSLVTIKNSTFGDFSRRHAKITSGWVHFDNVTFNVTQIGNPNLSISTVAMCCSTTAAMIGDGSTVPGANHKYINCTFNGTGGVVLGKRMVPGKTEDLEIRGNTFIDYDIDLQGNIEGIVVNGNDFDNNSTIYNTNAVFEDGANSVQICDNNTGNASFNQLSASQHVMVSGCSEPIPPPVGGGKKARKRMIKILIGS